MRLTRIKIRNFRSIRNLDLDLGETTMFIGPNNVGKTAILDTVRLALTRRWGENGTRFRGTDVGDALDGNGESGACITLWAEESAPGEWPREVAEVLDPTGRAEPREGRHSLGLRCRFGRNEERGRFEESRELLDATGKPVRNQYAFRENVELLWRCLPVFYLGVMRDVDGTFSPRPRFWEEYLKALEIPVGLESSAADLLKGLYRRLQEGDSKTENIMNAITLSNPLALNRGEGPDPFMLPGEVLSGLAGSMRFSPWEDAISRGRSISRDWPQKALRS